MSGNTASSKNYAFSTDHHNLQVVLDSAEGSMNQKNTLQISSEGI